MTSGRHIVHEKVADAYIAALAERASRLPVGDPYREAVAIGPLITPSQVERVHALVTDATAAGATVLAGGIPDAPFYPPTVLAGIDRGMRVWREEIFGPVAPVLVVSSDEEAVAVANDTEYGLSSGVYTSSPEHGREVAAKLRTGIVHIGDQTVDDDARTPFGGTGASGNGARFGGPSNLEEFTSWQWLTERNEPASYPF
jgi:benzaldehyde dehydrogenase (NAD)